MIHPIIALAALAIVASQAPAPDPIRPTRTPPDPSRRGIPSSWRT
jgi:hypothetical protein